jgi:hypothetical protein
MGLRICLDASENGKSIVLGPGIEHTYLTIRRLVTVLTELTQTLFPKHTYCIRSCSQCAILLKLPTSLTEIKKKKKHTHTNKTNCIF